MSITDSLRKAFDDCTVMAGVEGKFECVYITKAAALKLLDEIDEAFAEGHARAVEYGKASVAGESRWHELFGTPERAARTITQMQMATDLMGCCDAQICPAAFKECWKRDSCPMEDYDALLEWLRGDAK